MPVYEYDCLHCGRQFEEIQSIKDKPLKTCKFCKGTVRRLISKSSFALKGGGWYRDGYGKKVKNVEKKPAEVTSSPSEKSKPPKEAPKDSEKKTKPLQASST